ncbi:sensor histidine kinase [Desulfovibrio oxyclinae]|uniref:sensor histidine kinase n=1 Tax=Desulfovibrio oxyclinae TaxID=63560 RepID=UPI00037AF304|nr:ATP-binding protein [Desulfovibrio oxyclinae]
MAGTESAKRGTPLFPGRGRSLSRDLTASLVVIVVFFATAMIAYTYWHQSRDMRDAAERKAGELTARVVEILAVPIWNLDYENARLIGAVYAQNEMVQGFRIYGSRNDVIYAHEKMIGIKPDFRRVKDIVFEGRTIGRAEIDFTLMSERDRLERQMLVSVMLILVSVVVILAVTGILLRVFLATPLQVLQKGISRVARGDFSYDFGEIYHSELLEIAERFRKMSTEIEARERKLQVMNNTLQEAEEKYRGIFENAVEGIFQCTPEGELLNANPAMARFFGYDSVKEFLLRTRNVKALMFVDGERGDMFLDAVTGEGEIIRFEAQYRRKDGSIVWGSINARTVHDRDGNIVSIEGILEDTTDRKKAEEELADLNRHLEQLVRNRTEDLVRKARELEDANRRLRELDEMKSAFLSSVSHELRTPLTSILGFAKLLSRDFNKNFKPMAVGDDRLMHKSERINENLEIIGQEGERLTRLINDVLDLIKIESGSMGWQDRPMDIGELVGRGVQAVKGIFEQRSSVRLIQDIDPNLPKVMVDPDRMQQVFINLLNNAAKFTEDGTVTVRARMAGNEMMRVEIEDTGVGIAAEELDSIFEKFHQSSLNIIKHKPQGTGLGLTICREIVEHYGGHIWVESSLGEGSTFVFTLPLE